MLLVGSSSLVQWKTLVQDLAPIPVINRGFGGSHIQYINRWFDVVVAPCHPRAIVFYAGENDVAAGKPVEQILSDFDEFIKKMRAAFGKTPVYFISLKLSKARWWQLSLQHKANDSIRARAESEADLYYIDVASSMLDDGRLKDIYVADSPKCQGKDMRCGQRLCAPHCCPMHSASCRVAGRGTSIDRHQTWESPCNDLHGAPCEVAFARCKRGGEHDAGLSQCTRRCRKPMEHRSTGAPHYRWQVRFEDLVIDLMETASKGYWSGYDARNEANHASFAGAAGHTCGR